MQLLARDKIKISGNTQTLARILQTNAHTNNTCAKTASANLRKAKNNILNQNFLQLC